MARGAVPLTWIDIEHLTKDLGPLDPWASVAVEELDEERRVHDSSRTFSDEQPELGLAQPSLPHGGPRFASALVGVSTQTSPSHVPCHSGGSLEFYDTSVK